MLSLTEADTPKGRGTKGVDPMGQTEHRTLEVVRMASKTGEIFFGRLTVRV